MLRISDLITLNPRKRSDDEDVRGVGALRDVGELRLYIARRNVMM